MGIDIIGLAFPVMWFGTEGTNMGIDIIRGDKHSALERAGGIVLVYVSGKIVIKVAGWLAKNVEKVTDVAAESR